MKNLETLSKDDATKLFKDTVKSIKKYENEAIAIKKYFYQLVFYNAHVQLGYETCEDMFRELMKDVTSKHRSTINDYKNAVFVEVELGIEHGVMGTEPLIAIKEHVDQKYWKRLYKLAQKSCDNSQEYPTKKQIEDAKLRLYAVLTNQNTTKDKSPKVENKVDKKNHDGEFTLEDDDDDVDSSNKSTTVDKKQITKEVAQPSITTPAKSKQERILAKTLKTIEKFSAKDKKQLLSRLEPTNDVDIAAAQLLHYTDDSQLKKIKKQLAGEIGT